MMSVSPANKDPYVPPITRTLLVGSVAHILETVTLGHFLDRIKVQQEASPNLNTMKKAARSILQTDGFKPGFRWNLILSASKGACGWGIHNLCTKQLSRWYPQGNPTFPSFSFTLMVGGSTALIESTLFICPLERMKTIEMTTPALEKKQTFDATFFKRAQYLFKGWRWTVLRQSCSWISYLGAYQHIRGRLLNYNEQATLSLPQKMLLGAGTGSLAACLNAPFDLMKTQVQKWAPSDRLKSRPTMTTLFQSHGWKGIYNALSVKLLRNTWSSLVVTLTFDYLNAFPQTMKISL